MGLFALQDQLEGGMAVYKNPSGQYLYYYTPHASWKTGSDVGSNSAYVNSISGPPMCPQNVAGINWKYFADEEWSSGTLSVTCGIPGKSLDC